MLIELKNETLNLEIAINDLKIDSKRNKKKTELFGDVFKEKPICMPDMDVSLDLSNKKQNDNNNKK